MGIETVPAVRILEHGSVRSLDLDVLMEDADPEADLSWDLPHAGDRASWLWSTFLGSVDAECEVLQLAQ